MIYGLGMQELLVILAIAMLLFGGKKLPEVGRNLGKAIRGFKEAEEETKKELETAVDPSTPRQGSGQADPGQEGGEEAPDEETERQSDPSASSGQAGETEEETSEETKGD